MKQVLLFIIFIFSNLSSDETINKELETIFFKTGLDALISDFESEKNTTSQQQKSIDFLMKKVYIHEQILKKLPQETNQNQLTLPLNDKEYFQASNEEKKMILDLIKEVASLKQELQSYKQTLNQTKLNNQDPNTVKLTDQNISNEATARIATKEATLRLMPNAKAPIVKTLFRGQMMQIQWCNKYDWCKLKDQEAYIAKFLLKFY